MKHTALVLFCAAGTGWITNRYFKTDWATAMGVAGGAIIGTLIYMSLYDVASKDM